ncbi:MAG TPA: transcription termination factor NusA [Candidatus Aminicenantes bacterium]|nr:transcription termination factor NusA [Candidatus Aminicenantes bacterium]HRY66296.1 transcription termination factor NusA [Candidatus Aminicenantes bacterium]HRZ73184.1 transcription termination factor NusA [Candidatus Aminicenantes bacterium]
MKVNVWNTILQLSKERGVEPRVIIQAIEESLRVASAKFFSQKENVQVLFRPEKGELRVFAVKTAAAKPKNPAEEISLAEARAIRPEVKEGETVEIDLPSDTLGRIAAQAAKQVIFQKVRDAEQEKIINEFAPRIGEIVTGVVRRVEDGFVILEVNKTEVALPLREKLPDEQIRRGDLVKAVITQVLKGYQGPQIIVSRSSPRFLARLLETEIPEIANGTIEIKDIVRQPGERAKVAVVSRERDIDPIGACIGVKGNRILAISKELGGEKVDIIPWSPDLVTYAKASLSPARVDRLQVASRNEKAVLAVVPQDQLSLAIGKKGINVKLASRLVGWKISIKQEDAHD